MTDFDSAPTRDAIGRKNSVALSLFILLCLFYAAWPIWRAFFPLEIDPNEAWNAYHADAAMGGHVLYPERSSLVANNYPPLSYYLIGLISRFSVDAVYVGRALSLLSVASITLTVALCIRKLNGSWFSAALGGAWFLGVMVRYSDWYVGMNDPHLLALAVMSVAFLWFLHRDPKAAPEPIVLLIVLAGFIKHTVVAIPATVFWRLAVRNLPRALLTAAVGILAALAGILICVLLFGPAFIEQLFLYPREISVIRSLRSLERLGGVAPAVIISAIWAWHDRKTEEARLVATFLAFSFLSYLLQKLGEGLDVNAQFELNVASAIGVGLAFDRVVVLPIVTHLNVERSRLAITGVLSLCLLAAPGLEPYFLLASADYRAQFWTNSEIMRSEVRRIAAIPAKHLTCTILSVCHAAGKSFDFDNMLVSQKYYTSCRSYRELLAHPQTAGLQSEHIDERAALLPLFRQLPYGRVQRRSKPTPVEIALSGSAPCEDGT